MVMIILITVLIVNNENIMRKPSYQQVQMGHRLGLGFYIIQAFYKGIGHFLILLNHVLLVPCFIILAEVERCDQPSSGTSDTLSTNSTLSLNSTVSAAENLNFICLDNSHKLALSTTVIGTFSGVILAILSCFFVNSQFPSPNSLPQSVWETKPRAYMVIWKLIYIFHYDIFDPKYHVAFRVAAFYIYYQIMEIRLSQPRGYDLVLHYLELFLFSNFGILHAIVIMQDIGILSMTSFTREIILFEEIFAFLFFGILVVRENRYHKQLIAKNNLQVEEFEEESEMELYINILLDRLEKLTSDQNETGLVGESYQSSPEIFTIISRHMQNCDNADCICRKYEAEWDKKFSQFSMNSRRFTQRQSSTFTSSQFGDQNALRKKMPIKITYKSKCDIFKAELADCMERFLSSTICKSSGAGVGIKLQKSYFHHAYMNSSYKALFVQLENSYSCNTFRGKVHIYHLKTRIQEEMTQSDTSPINSLDLSTCIRFEAKRIIFEQRILDLCLGCESFWSELINKSILQNSQSKINTSHQSIEKKKSIHDSEDEDEEEQETLNTLIKENEMDLSDDYDVDKMNNTLLDIAANIIDIKSLFTQLQALNPQSVAVLQSYMLVYRFILRDEYRFEEIVNSLGQLYRTNKLEQSRDSTPIFCESDDYSVFVVSGDVKDLGRILRVNRAVDQLIGYTPEELKGSKINKIMPYLYSVIHDDFMQSFLKRGASNFIDNNQFVPILNKLGFIILGQAFVKAQVDLKLGLMFVTFFKAPHKIPMNYDPRDGGCTPSQGALFVKSKDAHLLFCDGKGNIQNMSQNCMRNLGLPPNIVIHQNKGAAVGIDERGEVINGSTVNINQFAPNIMDPEFEFDLVKGMNFYFDSSFLKSDKALAKEYSEIKNRMCRYNISVTLKRAEYKKVIGQGTFKSCITHEMCLFTILINSYAFTDTPNIIIPVFREEEEQVGQLMVFKPKQDNSAQHDMLTSKFKLFKAQVQELTQPSKVLKLRKIAALFFGILLILFSVSYGLLMKQDIQYDNLLSATNILFELQLKVPQTTRFVRTVLDIASGLEINNDEILSESTNNERFEFYMRQISLNSESFRSLQQMMLTNDELNLKVNDPRDDIFNVNNLTIYDLQSDFKIKQIQTSLSSGINLFLSKALQISKLQKVNLANLTIPYIDFRFDKLQVNTQTASTSLQQDLFFILENGQKGILTHLQNLLLWNQHVVKIEKWTYALTIFGLCSISILAVIFIMVPMSYPLLTHYERLAEIILHTLNKLPKPLVEIEVVACSQLYEYIANKSASEQQAKAKEKKRVQIEEGENDFEETMHALKRKQTNQKRKVAKKIRQEESKGEGTSQFKQIGGANKQSETVAFSIMEAKSNFIDGSEVGTSGTQGSITDRRKLVIKNKWSLPSLDSWDSFANEHIPEEDEQEMSLIKFAKRGHMPPIMRRPSYYEKMAEDFVEMDSFREDESRSNDSSQSNFSNQDMSNPQIQLIKEMGLLDPENQEKNGLFQMIEGSQAKTSLMDPSLADQSEDKLEQQKTKLIIAQRRNSIKENMKKSRCRTLILILLVVFGIVAYFLCFSLYAKFVFDKQYLLKEQLIFFHQRNNCYPYSLDVLKNLITGGQIPQGAAIDRSIIVQCYSNERRFQDILLGSSNLTDELQSLSDKYLAISETFQKGKLCQTLKQQQASSFMIEKCETVENGINQEGLHEVLNFIMREEEKIIIQFNQPPINAKLRQNILKSSNLHNLETLFDIFIMKALDLQRINMLKEIINQKQAFYLWFHVLFGIFISALSLGSLYLGLVFLTQTYHKKIVKIYHIVMLIPYGDRTHREINELIKIDL